MSWGGSGRRRRARPNHRLLRIHRSYTVEEAARTLGVHRNTIRRWLADGLAAIDDRRPILIHGLALSQFLQARHRRARTPCAPGQLYCVRCRAARYPAAGMVDYVPFNTLAGNLRGICPECETLMHRRVSRAGIEGFVENLKLAFPQAQTRIGDSASPTVNSDSSEAERSDADVQP